MSREIVLLSGRRIRVPSGVIGIGEDLRPMEGYEDTLLSPSLGQEGALNVLTDGERKELAFIVINRWLDWAEDRPARPDPMLPRPIPRVVVKRTKQAPIPVRIEGAVPSGPVRLASVPEWAEEVPEMRAEPTEIPDGLQGMDGLQGLDSP